MANKQLDGYMNQVGDKLEVIVDHDGPASYANPTPFTANGEVINASDFGLGAFEVVDPMGLSSDQLNTVLCVVGDGSGKAATTCRIHWFVQSTGAEVANAVNLSGKSIRLQIRGV